MNRFAKAPTTWFGLVLAAACLSGTPVRGQPSSTEQAPPPPAAVLDVSARLAEPATTERLKLTDEQRVNIANLRTERADALAKAPPSERDKVAEDYERKLLALLTDEQRAELAKATEEATPEPRLRFNFRFQRWSDVLEWFAGQANLSLVLDAPPPGTFNYSDNREYTVSEALDLLNGVLLTKGYTLIRRERMLAVIDLADGVPEALVPRITLTDLDKRGKFEIVSILFPLGERNVDDVVKEITPLLGVRGKSFPLPKTKQLLVIDTAGVMRAINAVIESIPQPDKPVPVAGEKPELVVYPLKSADPDAAIKVLQALLPEGRFVRDPKSNQISAFATPSQQTATKRVLDQMQTTEGPPEQQARFEVYTLDEGDPKQSLATLQPLVPNARLSVDPTSKKLAAWGTAVEHDLLKKAVAQLGQGPGARDDRQVEVYRLTKADPVTTLTTLQAIVPRAKLAVDPPTRSLIALASLGDQQTIRATLEQLDPQKQDPNSPHLRFYPFEKTPPANLATVLQTLAPKAQVTIDSAAKRIAVVATPGEHIVVKETIDEFSKAAPIAENRQLVLYPVSTAERKRFQLVLQELTTEFPNVKVLTDAEPGELAVWARPAEHKVIAEMIESIKRQAPTEESYRLVAYAIKSADPASVLAVLQNLFPSTKLVLDAKSRRLVVWTRPAEQESIKSLIEQMDTDAPAESQNKLMVYPITGADPSAAITTLKSLAPDATLTSDTKASTIVVWARPSDQKLIAAALERMQPGADPKRKPHVVAYPVGAADATSLYPLVSALVPTARVVPNAKNGTIAVWATPEDHETIRAAIDEMTKNGPLDAETKVVVYPLKAAEPASVVSMLQTLFPAARSTVDAKNRRLFVFGRPEEHQAIQRTIDQMDAKPDAETDRQLAVFPIVGADPTATITMLKSLVPETTLTSDTKASTIVAWGPKAELDQIAPAIERMQPGADPKRKPKIVSYPVGSADPAAIYPLISALVPTARVVANTKAGSIAVWATPEDHETIRGAIEEMTAKQSDANAGKVVVYSLRVSSAASVISALQTSVPEARLGVGQNSRKLVAWARPADHETIRKALEDLDQEETDRPETELKSYAITTADASSLLSTLQALFGARREVRLSLDTKNNKIVALAMPAQHEAIRGVIEEIERGSPLDTGAQLEVHPLHNADPEVVMQVLNNLVTKQSRALLSIDAKAKQLIAVAPPPQQATIRSAIERLQSAPRQFEVLQLEVLEPSTAQAAIEKLFAEPSAGGGKSSIAPTVDSDVASQRLFVRASAEQIAQIRDLLVKMGETNLATSRSGTVRVIPFSGDTREVLAEIQRVWPQLSKNPLQVLGTDESPRKLRALPDRKTKSGPNSTQPAEPARSAPEGDEQEPARDKQTRLEIPRRPIQFQTAAREDEDPGQPDQPASQVAAGEQAQEPQAPPEAKAPQPIIVTPGDDRITIMSDDPQAIERFEALLRALSPRTGAGGRDIMVYPLHSASSTTVAELLKGLFRRSGFDTRDSSVVIESDQRLNAIVVYAGRNDRAAIERLLKTLDSEDVPESLVANRPTLIPVKNTSALRVELVLKDIYKTQLTSGGVKQQIPVPSGASREVAAVIQQINTAASGPLMSLSVDDTTNSLVVMAPGPLVQEIRDLVEELDDAALNDTSRGVKIVKLKSTSALRVKEILDALIKDAVRRKASGTSRP